MSVLLEKANQLLEPGYLPTETGFYRLSDGHMHLAVFTRMPHCTGKMVDWWFGYLDGTEEYKIWEPKSHVRLEWDENRIPGRYIGASCIVEKKLGGRIIKLRIHFHEPSEFLDRSKFEEAGVVTAICANAYDLEKVPLGRIIHFVRDTEYGCEMRSRFWLYKASESVCMELMQHCMEEMGNLADFLTDFYARENEYSKEFTYKEA
jgi:hypothetical protein